MATRPAKDWRDRPDESTPISAAALEDLEARAFTYAEQVAAEASPPSVESGILGPVRNVQGFGHSFMASGYDVGYGFLDLLAAKLGATLDNQAQGGTALQESAGTGWGKLMQTVTRPAASTPPDLCVLMHGLNDLAKYGASLVAFEHALRASIARLRVKPGGIHETTADPTLSAGLNGGVGPAVVAATTNSGSDYWSFIDALAYAQIYPTASWAGGALTVQLLALPGKGAQLAENVNGSDATRVIPALDTRGVCRITPVGSVIPVVRRIQKFGPGVGNYVQYQGIAGQVATSWQIDCWSEEAASPPVVLVVEQPRLPHYAGGLAYVATDADIDALNVVIRRVCAEFGDGRVISVGAPALLHPDLLRTDLLHPSRAGAKLLSDACYQALKAAANAAPRTPEARRLIGTPGQPAFGGNWGNYGNGYRPLSFYKDTSGFVHLEGTVTPVAATVSGDVIAGPLPAGYAPDAIVAQGPTLSWYVNAAGNIVWNGGNMAAGATVLFTSLTYGP